MRVNKTGMKLIDLQAAAGTVARVVWSPQSIILLCLTFVLTEDRRIAYIARTRCVEPRFHG